MIKADLHLHSDYSDDSVEPMDYQIERAVELGLSEICFTDHVDYGQKRDWDDPKLTPQKELLKELSQTKAIHYLSNVNYDEYFAKLKRMRKQYDGIISVKSGLELGVQSHRLEQNQKIVNKYKDEIDFILLSFHQIADNALWNHSYFEGRKQDEYVLAYYQEMLNVVKAFDGYDSVAHMDLITRYDPKGVYPFKKIKPIVSEILKVIINNQKSLEINTSSWRYKIGDTTPCTEIVKLYREFGGSMLTVGSDAHYTKNLGEHFEDVETILKNFGFKGYYTYTKRNPKFNEF